MSKQPTPLSAALGSRREGAVRALVRTVAPSRPDVEQLGLNRAAAALIDVAPGADPDTVVRDAARDALAAHLQAVAPVRSRGVLRRGTPCAVIPGVLAARAAGRLGPDDRERLARHLSRCPACSALAARMAAADDAFDAAAAMTDGGPSTAASVDWLADAVNHAAPASPRPAASEWLVPGDAAPASATAVTTHANDDSWAAPVVAATEDVRANDWLPAGLPSAGAGDATATSDDEWLLDEDAEPRVALPARAGATGSTKTRSPIAAAVAVVLLLGGAGATLAASGVLDSSQRDPSPPAVARSADTTTSARQADKQRVATEERRRSAARKRKAERAAALRKKRAAALRKKRAAARQRPVVAQPVAARPVARAPVVQQTAPAVQQAPATKPTPAPAPAARPAPTPTPSPSPSGPTSAPPSGEPGRTPPGT